MPTCNTCGEDFSRTDSLTRHRKRKFPCEENGYRKFPDDDEAGDVDEFANTIKWREVIENVWIRVEYLLDVNTQYRPAVVVGLLKRDGETIRAWTTTLIGQVLTEKEKKKGSKNVYIKSTGKKLSKNEKKSYYNFQLKLF